MLRKTLKKIQITEVSTAESAKELGNPFFATSSLPIATTVMTLHLLPTTTSVPTDGNSVRKSLKSSARPDATVTNANQLTRETATPMMLETNFTYPGMPVPSAGTTAPRSSTSNSTQSISQYNFIAPTKAVPVQKNASPLYEHTAAINDHEMSDGGHSGDQNYAQTYGNCLECSDLVVDPR